MGSNGKAFNVCASEEGSPVITLAELAKKSTKKEMERVHALIAKHNRKTPKVS